MINFNYNNMFLITLFSVFFLNLNAKNNDIKREFDSDVLLKIEDLKNNEALRVDAVFFSYDRPMQLYSFLESVKQNIKNIASISVIYRVSSDEYETAYEIVKQKFNDVSYFKQGNEPSKDFKQLLLKAAFEDSKKDYFMFGVDDIIVTDEIDINECIDLIETQTAAGFFLRLGKNIDHCYTVNQNCGVPNLKEVKAGIFSWQFKDGSGDWGLPASTDMTIYRKNDFKNLFYSLNYTNPNNFEGYWIASSDKTKFGLCYENSKIVNIPINIVQDLKWHRSMNFLLPEDLLEIFLDGYKIDIEDVKVLIQNKRNKAPHIEYILKFIPRINFLD